MNPNSVLTHRSKRGVPAGLGWTLIVFGLFFLAVVVFKDAPLALFGRIAEGEIIRITERTSSDHSPRRRGESRASYRARTRKGGVSHVLTLRYAPAGEAARDIETLATWGFSEKVGDRVQVIYLPDEPDDAEIYSAKQLWLPLATGCTVTTLCLVGGGFIVRASRRRRKR
jgi:hypothetical protein